MYDKICISANVLNFIEIFNSLLQNPFQRFTINANSVLSFCLTLFIDILVQEKYLKKKSINVFEENFKLSD
jgi:hypothetical protein